MNTKICLLLLLCPIHSMTQSITKPLSIGDTLPPIQWSQALHTTAPLTMASLKGQWVILDFWATWCSACTGSLNLIDSLQVQFKENLRFVLVNPKASGDDSTRIQRFWNKRNKLLPNASSLTITWGDTVAYNYFMFHVFPRYIWIDPQGIVRAITGKQELTQTNIEAILKGTMPNWPVKQDPPKNPIINPNKTQQHEKNNDTATGTK